MMESVPMTQEGYNKIKNEIIHLETVEMPRVAELIAAARAEGDLSENAEYHGQREAQGLLQAKINMLKSKLANASIVDPSDIPKDIVGLGATVRVLDVDRNKEQTMKLVGAGEEDYDKGWILTNSPIGQGLVGKKIGDTAAIEVPRGTINYKVMQIEYDH